MWGDGAGLRYGGDYNPEQWPAEVWREDVALMRRARVNLVTVGVFAWSRLEPEPGRYTFDWLDQVLDLLHDNGISVALATPTASPPPWFSLAHPDALPVTADGVRLHHGSRDTYCAAAPAYRAAARRIAAALADRYAHHPALALWHVHNEYGTTCHCPHTAREFRRWLADRHGDLVALNAAWATSFWSQHYTDWAQVDTPRATQYLANPGHLLDFRRFWSDTLLAAYAEQRDLLRAAKPAIPITTNHVLGDWVPVDHARWAAEVDLVAIDHYPDATDGGAEEQTALAADLARGWARHGAGDVGHPARWLLMESAPNQIHSGGRMHTKEPGRMARHSLSHVARGSRGRCSSSGGPRPAGRNVSTPRWCRTPAPIPACSGRPSTSARRWSGSRRSTARSTPPSRSPGTPRAAGPWATRGCRRRDSTTATRCRRRTGRCGVPDSAPTSCCPATGSTGTACWCCQPSTWPPTPPPTGCARTSTAAVTCW